MSLTSAATLPVFLEETRKTLAFVRRDFLIAWSYRTAFFTDWINMLVQVAVFYFVGRLVDPAQLPTFGGGPVSYAQFVAVGIAVTSFVQVGLNRVVMTIRGEQLMGTLESLLVTPTAPTTIQLGSVMYDLVYVPIRTAIFLALTAAVLGVRFEVSGILPAVTILLAFIPVVWGLGMVGAAGVLVFRRGLGVVGLLTVALSATSSTYFPIELFPAWLRSLAQVNPITVALLGARGALLGDAGWSGVLPSLAKLLPVAVAAIWLGAVAFRLALRHERRRGTLGLY